MGNGYASALAQLDRFMYLYGVAPHLAAAPGTLALVQLRRHAEILQVRYDIGAQLHVHDL